jgi:hypothetical protein
VEDHNLGQVGAVEDHRTPEAAEEEDRDKVAPRPKSHRSIANKATAAIKMLFIFIAFVSHKNVQASSLSRLSHSQTALNPKINTLDGLHLTLERMDVPCVPNREMKP